MPRISHAAALALAAVTPALYAQPAPQPTRLVALSGEELVAGLTFAAFGTPTINNQGDLAFTAFVRPSDNPVTPSQQVVMTIVDGVASIAARVGEPVADSQFTLATIGRVNFSDAGDVAFTATVIGSGVTSFTNDAVFLVDDGTPRLVARENRVPVQFDYGVPGRLLTLGQDGTVATSLPAIMNDGEQGRVIQRFRNGTVELVAEIGDPATTPADASWTDLSDFTVDQNGVIYFSATLAEDPTLGIDDFSNDQIVRYDDAGPHVVLANDDPRIQPSTGTPVSFGLGPINRSGHLVIAVTYATPTDVLGSQTYALIDDELHLLYQRDELNQFIPDVDDTLVWGNSAVNAHRAIAFNAGDSPRTQHAFGPTHAFLKTDRDLRLIAQTGDTLPGTDEPMARLSFSPLLNDVGDVVFRANRQGSSAFNDAAVLVYLQHSDSLRLIARAGDEIGIDGGARTVRRIATDLDPTDGSSALNNRRELAYTLTFTDGSSGVFVTTLGPLPCNPADLEPPYAQLDLSDTDAFIAAFLNQDPLADLAAPFGLIDLDDVDTFITAFLGGCP